MELLSSAKGGYESMLSIFGKINALNIDHLEKLADKQMETAKYYTEVGLSQLKGMQGFSSLEDVKDFSSGHVETSTKIAKKMLEDSKEVASIGSSYKDGVVDLVKSLSEKTS